MHNVDYGVVATFSSQEPGSPFANVVSVSDGPKGDAGSTGRLIFYAATISVFTADTAAAPRVAFAVTEEQTPKGCVLEDPEWPLCARVCSHSPAFCHQEGLTPFAAPSLSSSSANRDHVRLGMMHAQDAVHQMLRFPS